MKINVKKHLIELEEECDIDIDDLAMELPSSPRFIAYSYVYKKKDGRTSNPLVFIFFCPRGTPNNLNMLYASSKTQVVNALQIGKVFEIRDAETLTEDWLKEKLDFFK
eukprot:TRINITY_DN1212_c0_g1_i1.p1 TRINITY_DN1212_c0_g1~~TRINITY_DN1212_c0_g1_i1.p1  ORF type:complete len:108 (-),score=23.15 TRINITY_DN1212_c0_g1_i1:31-354(-)